MSKKRPKVLVIDDSQATLNLVVGYLSMHELETLTATHVAEGLAQAREHLPDLILCDIVMPERDGYDLLREVRADLVLAETPVVLMSGVSAMQDRLRAADSGADDLLTKPFDKAELIARVKALLRLKARQDEVHQANARLRERIRLLSTLFVISNQLRESLDPGDIFRVINETLVTITEAETFTIYVRERESSIFRLVVNHGITDPYPPEDMDGNDLPERFKNVVESGHPFYNEQKPEAEISTFGHPLYASVPVKIIVPLIARQEVIGLINVHQFSPSRGDYPDFEILTLLSSQVAGALQAVRMINQLQQYATELEQTDQNLRKANKNLEARMFHINILSLFSAQLHSTIKVADVYAAVRDLAINFIGVEAFITRYYDEWEGISTYVGIADNASVSSREIKEQLFLGLEQKVMETGKAFFQSHPDPIFGELISAGAPLPIACLPLLIEDQAYGVFIIERMLPQKDGFTKEDYELMALLAQEAALSIRNSHLHRHVEQLSDTDGLTGAYNRRHFDHQIIVEFKRNQRYEHSLALIMLDIDNFKAVNDQYGHLAGDDILREIVRRISQTLRDVDIVARYGGEEFILILPETQVESASLVAERIRQDVCSTPMQSGELEIAISVSLGIASSPPFEEITTLIEAADQALYRAKRNGKNRVEMNPYES